MILSINISNSKNLNKFWVSMFTLQGHINQVYWVSESVSQWVSDKGKQWSDSGPIKIKDHEDFTKLSEPLLASRSTNAAAAVVIDAAQSAADLTWSWG